MSKAFTQSELQRLYEYATCAQLHIDTWTENDKRLMQKIFSKYAFNKEVKQNETN